MCTEECVGSRVFHRGPPTVGQVLRTLRMTYDTVLYMAPKHVLAQSVGVFKPPPTHAHKKVPAALRLKVNSCWLMSVSVCVCACASDDSVLSAPQ